MNRTTQGYGDKLANSHMTMDEFSAIEMPDSQRAAVMKFVEHLGGVGSLAANQGRPTDPDRPRPYISPRQEREIERMDDEWRERDSQDSRLVAAGYSEDEIAELDDMGMIDDFGNVAEI